MVHTPIEHIVDYVISFGAWNLIRGEKKTNKHCDQLGTRLQKCSNKCKCKKTIPGTFKHISEEEMLAYFGINIVMEIVRLPEMHDYWRSGIYSLPWFRQNHDFSIFENSL